MPGRSGSSSVRSGTRPEAARTGRLAHELSLIQICTCFALVVLSPLVAEFLFGATPISRMDALLPVTAAYGGGAVLVRELARRRGPGFGRIVALGVAYAIVEEGLALQSIFNPDLYNAGLVGGRAFGINWVWSLWTVGYHVVWSISIPILLAELLFPVRRDEPWLGRTGLTVTGMAYALGIAFLAEVNRLFIAPGFHVAAALESGAALLVIGLVALALSWLAAPARFADLKSGAKAPSPWMVGIVALLASGAWFSLLDLPHAARSWNLVILPLALGIVLAGGMAAFIRRWSAPGQSWSDLHSLALASGAMAVSMLWGFFFVTAGSRMDQVGQGISSVVAVILLAAFAQQIKRRVNMSVQHDSQHQGL